MTDRPRSSAQLLANYPSMLEWLRDSTPGTISNADAYERVVEYVAALTSEIAEARAEGAQEGARPREALMFAQNYGGVDGGHHKMWVIDQMVRALTGAGYAAWVRATRNGEEGPETYEWDEGIAP